MGWIQLATIVFQLALKLWDAKSEKDQEIKKAKTEAVQSGVRGLIDDDSSRIVSAFDDLRRLRR